MLDDLTSKLKEIISSSSGSDVFPIQWKQGQHMSVIGDTGSGKSFLMSQLVQMKEYAVVFQTKTDDIVYDGFRVVKDTKSLDNIHSNKILLRPEYKKQAVEGYRMLKKMYEQGGWAGFIDEHWYAERLGLKPYIERNVTQGRSLKISMVMGMQRPVQISRFILSQSEHVISFRVEPRDLRILAEATTDKIVGPIQSLNKYEFIYFNRTERILAKGTAKTLGSILKY